MEDEKENSQFHIAEQLILEKIQASDIEHKFKEDILIIAKKASKNLEASSVAGYQAAIENLKLLTLYTDGIEIKTLFRWLQEEFDAELEVGISSWLVGDDFDAYCLKHGKKYRNKNLSLLQVKMLEDDDDFDDSGFLRNSVHSQGIAHYGSHMSSFSHF